MPEITYIDADGNERPEYIETPKQDSVRNARGLLVQTDWTQLADTPDDVKASFAVYRGALRKIIIDQDISATLPVPPKSVYRFE